MKVAAEHFTLPKEGEKENGDAAIVRSYEGGALFAVVDALGHGPAAASVARTAIEHLSETSIAVGIEKLVLGLHERLRGSRGAAAVVCLFREDGHLDEFPWIEFCHYKQKCSGKPQIRVNEIGGSRGGSASCPSRRADASRARGSSANARARRY